jgi:hypothetical protein
MADLDEEFARFAAELKSVEESVAAQGVEEDAPLPTSATSALPQPVLPPPVLPPPVLPPPVLPPPVLPPPVLPPPVLPPPVLLSRDVAPPKVCAA